MAKLTVFYLERCPYCVKAKKAFDELKAGNPSYTDDCIEWIEESIHPDTADKYDYYYVPSIYSGSRKLYECSPGDDYETIRDNLRKSLDGAV